MTQHCSFLYLILEKCNNLIILFLILYVHSLHSMEPALGDANSCLQYSRPTRYCPSYRRNLKSYLIYFYSLKLTRTTACLFLHIVKFFLGPDPLPLYHICYLALQQRKIKEKYDFTLHLTLRDTHT